MVLVVGQEVKKFLKNKQSHSQRPSRDVSKQQINEQVDLVAVAGDILHHEQFVYYLLNKPKGVISATEDDHHRTVLDLLDEIAQQGPPPDGDSGDYRAVASADGAYWRLHRKTAKPCWSTARPRISTRVPWSLSRLTRLKAPTRCSCAGLSAEVRDARRAVFIEQAG